MTSGRRRRAAWTGPRARMARGECRAGLSRARDSGSRVGTSGPEGSPFRRRASRRRGASGTIPMNERNECE
jgi:hypothetical protein